MRIIYTIHAKEKLKEKESKEFRITKQKIDSTIKNPKTQETLSNDLIRIISKLDQKLSLVVVCKQESGKIKKVITFFPAEKGRYESKILR